MFRGEQAKRRTLLVLRHENVVLRRNAGRIRYEPGDRVSFAALTRFIRAVPGNNDTSTRRRAASRQRSVVSPG
jgi:hypothetical protein